MCALIYSSDPPSPTPPRRLLLDMDVSPEPMGADGAQTSTKMDGINLDEVEAEVASQGNLSRITVKETELVELVHLSEKHENELNKLGTNKNYCV